MKNISNLRMEVASQMSNNDDNEKHEPASWEIIMFRLLNAVMVIFFLTATVKLQGFVSLINQSYVSCVRRWQLMSLDTNISSPSLPLNSSCCSTSIVRFYSPSFQSDASTQWFILQNTCGGRPRLSSTLQSQFSWPWSGASNWSEPFKQRQKVRSSRVQSTHWSMKKEERRCMLWSASPGWRWPVTCPDTTSDQLDMCCQLLGGWSWPRSTSPLFHSCWLWSVFSAARAREAMLVLLLLDSRTFSQYQFNILIQLCGLKKLLPQKGFSCTILYLIAVS